MDSSLISSTSSIECIEKLDSFHRNTSIRVNYVMMRTIAIELLYMITLDKEYSLLMSKTLRNQDRDIRTLIMKNVKLSSN